MQERLRVNIMTQVEGLTVPAYAKHGDAGLDLTATEAIWKDTDEYISYKLGFAIAIPDGYVGLLFPRSSISKYDLTMCNSVGVIDSKY